MLKIENSQVYLISNFYVDQDSKELFVIYLNFKNKHTTWQSDAIHKP